jgi:predicted outer membrane protein
MVGKLKGLMVLVAGMCVFSLPVSAQNAAPAPAQVRPTGPDQELVAELHQLGRNQMRTAILASERAVSAPVGAFAASVQREHSIANDLLEQYALRKNMNMDVIARPGTALPNGVLANAPLVNASNREFDYRFMSRMVADHQASIDASAAAQRIARDPELKALIGVQIAMLSEHEATAQRLLAQIPEPTPRSVPQPAFPAPVSRTQTGADQPSLEAVQQFAPPAQPIRDILP